MRNHPIVSQAEWLGARLRLLAKEKEFTRQRDQLSEERRALPWVKVEKEYVFDGPNGREALPQLFQGNSQLLIYHFMYGTDWNEGCKNCSFWADSFDGITAHLKHRDVTMIVVSRAPYAKLNAFRKRMGWRFKWVSSGTSDFNHDFNVSFTSEEMKGTVFYNYEHRKFPLSEAPGISVFYKDDAGAIFHTYSCYGRGLDAVNGAYQLLDLGPKEEEIPDIRFRLAELYYEKSRFFFFRAQEADDKLQSASPGEKSALEDEKKAKTKESKAWVRQAIRKEVLSEKRE